MSKLTLSVDPAVVERAKRYAKRRGVSLSQMVEDYLAALSKPPAAGDDPPVLRSLRGILKGSPEGGYKEHLLKKYG
jgi:hypothetical protein